MTTQKIEIKVDGIEIKSDGLYYRVHIKLGTHTFHSEKLNIETAATIQHELITGKKL